MKTQRIIENTKKNNNRGITLIALVVTVIVLLILATVSIQMLTGENGIIRRAKEAKDNTEKATAGEKIKLEVLGSMDIYGTPNANKLKTALTSIGATVKGSTLPFLATLDGHDFTISEDGTTYEISKNAINIAKMKVEVAEIDAKIKKAEDEEDETTLTNAQAEKLRYYQELYGKVVDYEPKATIQTSTATANTPKKAQWKIFYADENNIYLIADSYVTYDSLPSTETVSFAKSDANNLYKANFNNSGLLTYYAGGTTKINTYAKANVVKALNKDFFYWKNPSTNLEEGLTGTNYNSMKAVAAMLDTDFWDTKYKDNSEYVYYTIGGPTIEMLFASYNQTHNTNYGAKAYRKGEKNSDDEIIANWDGYKISENEDTDRITSDWEYSNYSILDININLLYNKLYVSEINNINSEAYCICSPDACFADATMLVNWRGGVGHGGTNQSNSCFRPLVCLKSNVQLVEASGAKKSQGIDFELK